jgi:hypothetical protein
MCEVWLLLLLLDVRACVGGVMAGVCLPCRLSGWLARAHSQTHAQAKSNPAPLHAITNTHTEEAAAKPEAPPSEEEGEESDEEGSEYETDTDESEEGGGGLLSLPKPIFIPKVGAARGGLFCRRVCIWRDGGMDECTTWGP